jgi:hypothetical protein
MERVPAPLSGSAPSDNGQWNCHRGTRSSGQGGNSSGEITIQVKGDLGDTGPAVDGASQNIDIRDRGFSSRKKILTRPVLGNLRPEKSLWMRRCLGCLWALYCRRMKTAVVELRQLQTHFACF